MPKEEAMKSVIAVVLLLVTAGTAWGFDPESGCVACHGNQGKMKELGAEAMYLDPARVDQEVNMQGKPTCVDCHLGDPKALDKEAAHQGVLRPFLVGAGKKLKGEAISREAAGAIQPLKPKGEGMNSMLPKGDPQKLEQACTAGCGVGAELRFIQKNGELAAKSPEAVLRQDLKFAPIYGLNQGKKLSH